MAKKEEKYSDFRIGDTVYKTLTNKKYDDRKFWEYPDPNLMLSHIPGTCKSLPFKAGDSVKEGEVLLTFEAMKMESKIRMPYDGEIVKYNVEIGTRFPKEFVLVEIK